MTSKTFEQISRALLDLSFGYTVAVAGKPLYDAIKKAAEKAQIPIGNLRLCNGPVKGPRATFVYVDDLKEIPKDA